MAASLALALAGEPVELLAARALHWPARRRLLIADLHLGKADVFRRAGIGLPSGGTGHDLAALSLALDATGAEELWILGDALHGAVPPAPWQARWQDWRASRPGLQVVALAGNHDRALAGIAARLGVELAGESVDDGPFALRHHPEPHAARHVLCGHLHPRVALPGLPRRWPAFWLRQGMTVLPAWSEFTGGRGPPLAAGDRLVACVQGEIVALPPAR